MSNESGYRFQSIILLENVFKRNPQINFEKLPIPEVNIETDFNQDGDKIICNLKLVFKILSEKTELVKCECVFAGVFQKIGEPKLDVKTFGSINAPSIIFPFVREFLAGISLKAGLNPILLNPVNFAAMAERSKG